METNLKDHMGLKCQRKQSQDYSLGQSQRDKYLSVNPAWHIREIRLDL